MQGHLDSFLTDIGKRQAEAAGNYLKKDRFNAIYSSDLGRAHETAKIIDRYLNIGIKTDERLRERKLGILNMPGSGAAVLTMWCQRAKVSDSGMSGQSAVSRTWPTAIRTRHFLLSPMAAYWTAFSERHAPWH
jgi:hypothetical protein